MIDEMLMSAIGQFAMHNGELKVSDSCLVSGGKMIHIKWRETPETPESHYEAHVDASQLNDPKYSPEWVLTNAILKSMHLMARRAI